MSSKTSKQISVLASSTFAFTICFAVWMMFAVLGIPIKKLLGLNETQFGLLAATPVLTGSLIRVPLGIWTDKYGGRIDATVKVDGRDLAPALIAAGLGHPFNGEGKRAGWCP